MTRKDKPPLSGGDRVDAFGVQLDLFVLFLFGQLGIHNGVMMNEIMKQHDFLFSGGLGPERSHDG